MSEKKVSLTRLQFEFEKFVKNDQGQSALDPNINLARRKDGIYEQVHTQILFNAYLEGVLFGTDLGVEAVKEGAK